MGEVIRMDQVCRSELPSSYEEVLLSGFKKALKALDAVKCCSMRETLIAIDNWEAAEMLTRREADELVKWHGWERNR